MAPRHCWVGVGSMGKAMGKRLALKANLEEPLIVWSRNFSHSLELHKAAENTLVADSLETAVAYSDMIWTSLIANDDVLLTVFHQILSNCDVQGKLFVECSTIRPATANRIAAEVIARGGEYVAMPIIGNPGSAQSGVLTCIPSGVRESVDKVKPYLNGVLAQNVLDYGGEEPGKGLLCKMLGNMCIVNITESLAEGHVLADKCELGSERLEEFLEAAIPGPHLLFSRRFNTGAYYKSASVFDVNMARKVAELVLELAGSTGTTVPAFEIASKLMDIVAQEPGVSDDVGGIYGALRRSSGLPWGNK